MKHFALEVLLNPEWDTEHTFWNAFEIQIGCSILPKCKSLANQITTSLAKSLQHSFINLLSMKYWQCDGLFYPEHHKSTSVPYVHVKHDPWAGNEERAHNAELPIPCTTPVLNEACRAHSDFVNWISPSSCKTNLCWLVTLDLQSSNKLLKMRKKRLDEDSSARHGRRESETTRAKEWETGAAELIGNTERDGEKDLT